MTPTLSPQDRLAAAQWLAEHPTGASSMFLLATAIAGVPLGIHLGRWRFPRDAYDLGRCMELVAMAPGVREVAFPVLEAHPQWAALIRGWDELARLHANPGGRHWEENWHLVTNRMTDLITAAQ